MKTALPEREEYYRPTIARELRSKAARYDEFALVVRWCARIAVIVAALYGFGSLNFAGSGYLAGIDAFATLWHMSAASLLVAGALTLVKRTLEIRCSTLRRHAEALETEHDARYGPLPCGPSKEHPETPQL